MNLISHLKERNYDIKTSGIPWLGSDTITFPLFSFDKKLVGYQQYHSTGEKTVRKDPKLGKYFTYLPKGQPGVWGLESLHLSPGTILVCEGIFKTCRLHNAGFSAIAVLGNNPIHLKEQLGLLSLTNKVIIVPDPDKAGLKLLKYSNLNITPSGPLDDLTESEFSNFTNTLKEYLCVS